MSLEAPRVVTDLPGPKALELIERDAGSISPSYTRFYPLVVDRGEGIVIEDVDGNRFLDFSAGIAVTATGHCHPEVVEAIHRQSERLIHMSGTDFYYAPQIELAEELSRLAPVPQPGRTFMSNSGAEAVEAAIKLARHHTGRPQVIGFYGAFHGRTLGALSLTASKPIQRKGFSPLVPSIEHIPYADCRHCRIGPDETGTCCLEPLRFLEEVVFRRKIDPGEVAAIVFEPVQGEGGYIVPPTEFVDGLRAICDRHGILLVADEVQSGMGRTGKLFALEHFGIEADIVCLAKGIASGMPLGVTIAGDETMDWPPGSHASTFGGNPVSCAAALATLRLLREEKLIDNAAAVGERIRECLCRLQESHESIYDVRGLGLMIGVELARDGDSGEPDPQLRDDVLQRCFRAGLLLLPCGGSVLRFVPGLVVGREQADRALEIFEECLREAEEASR